MPSAHAIPNPLVIATASLLAANALAESLPLPACDGPTMKLLHYETVDLSGTDFPAGDAIVEFTVDTSGRVSDPRILNASDARLDEYALRSAPLWRYAAVAKSCRHRLHVLFSRESLP